jgi:hypothetical protein
MQELVRLVMLSDENLDQIGKYMKLDDPKGPR